MSKKRVCTICKHLGLRVESTEEIEIGNLYTGLESSNPVRIYLCRSHSVDLFKKG